MDRARIAAEQAVASPLLEGISLSGARGVLVNITASQSLKMREVNEVMNTIREFAADDATVIFGAVYDEELGDELRVTVVATGLGQSGIRAQMKPLSVVAQKTGTDNMPVAPGPNYKDLDMPTVFRNNRAGTLEALQQSGMETLDIPAFLRKQAD
jgi:cell division protein FtsZ